MADPDLAAFMIEYLAVAETPGVPEIRLHQAGPSSGLGRWAKRTGSTAPPYWAYVWAGGLVLARFLLDHPEQIAGRHVLDLGSGSGLVAIAAAHAGAASILARDIDPDAVTATKVNAVLNHVVVEASEGELPDGLQYPNTILVGDLFYASDGATHVAALLKRCVDAGCTVLVGDPGRADLPREHLEPLFSWSAPDFGTPQPDRPSTVYRFRGS